MKLEIIENGEIVGGCKGDSDTDYSWWYDGDSDLVLKALLTADDMTLPKHRATDAESEFEVTSEMEVATEKEKVQHVENAVTYLPPVDEVRKV